ncbi:pre-mRNA-processing factor 39-2 isoform X2 [Mercurialis annua]|uniref:pre-mRNA-processing factor 39-2 isoform X2 n=1 Tax=Mercurialis annua TaxID=3986 RepID=UPI00215E260B|nr:pre-mRNA-processing factor 39-2 isoform X2 [Mercurialis annua]
MEEQILSTENSTVVVINKAKLLEITANGSLEFDDWTSLISEVEKDYPDSVEYICLVYDSFLSEFPLCYGYWRKYVNHIIRLCNGGKVVEVFERAVASATCYVDLWVDYCCFGTVYFEDPSDVRRLFKRALSFVGKNYLCHSLWDKYIEFEFSLKDWSSLAHIYIQTLRFPTTKLHHYYDSFKKLVQIWEAEMQSCNTSSLMDLSEPILDNEASTHYNQDNIVRIIKDLLDPSIGSARSNVLQKYKSIGELFFQKASMLNEKISCFETHIKRPYFHVKPLDANQLENWHHYLDFAELNGDFDWAVQLYERCLIPCANYPEFWMRYVDFMDSKGGREIANYSLDRATQIFLKRVSVIHLFNARFKEYTGDVISARASFLQCNKESDSDFVENVITKSNMEKRLGNFNAASTTCKEAIEMAGKMEKWHILSILYVHLSRLKFMSSDSEDVARDILIDGIKHMPWCKSLLEELIKFAISRGGSRHMNVIDAIVADAISSGTGVPQGLSAKDREDISRLYLEFVDLCGSAHDVRKAWNRHFKLFPFSVRTMVFQEAAGTKQWKLDLEGEEIRVGLPHQPSEDSSSHCLIQSSLETTNPSSPELKDTQAAHPAADQISDQKSPVLINRDILPNEVSVQESPLLEDQNELANPEKVTVLQLGKSDNIVSESVFQVSFKVSEPSEDVSEQKFHSLDLECQVANETESTPAFNSLSKEDDAQKEVDLESEQDLKTPSLQKLSLDPQDAKSPKPISPASNEYGFPQNTILPKSELSERDSMPIENMLDRGQNTNINSSISSPGDTRATVSAQTNREYASPSATNQIVMEHAFPEQQKLGNSGRNWHQRNNSDRFHKDSKFGFRGNSNRRHYKQRQYSPQRTYQRAEEGSQRFMNQDYNSQHRSSQDPQVYQGGQVQNQYSASVANLTAPQAWPAQNLAQPPVQPTLYPQPQLSQIPMQSTELQGNLQTNEAYNQMWQNYYYQQQQLLWQQQQTLHHQQPQQQQLYQQQYEQQLLQLQYFQQQQGQQLQPQQQQQLVLQQQQVPYQQMQQQQSYQQQNLVYAQQQLPNQQSQMQQQQYHQQQTPSEPQLPHEQNLE